MSAGNACAAIGLANTVKIPFIGLYVQDITQPVGPGANGPYNGVIGPTFWNRNAIDEAVNPPYLVPATSGVAPGKDAQWVTTAVGLAAATLRVNITLGVAVADNAAGTHDVYCAPAGVAVPIGSFFWAFLR